MKNPWEAERYAMHSSGKNFLVAGLSPYKIEKIDAFASSFTKSSQKISTHLLTVLITRAIVQIEQRKGNEKKGSPESVPNVL